MSTQQILRVEPGDLAPPVTGHTDGYRLSRMYLLMMFITTIDVQNYFGELRPRRYLLILLPIAVAIIARLRRPSRLIRRPAGADLRRRRTTCAGSEKRAQYTVISTFASFCVRPPCPMS